MATDKRHTRDGRRGRGAVAPLLTAVLVALLTLAAGGGGYALLRPAGENAGTDAAVVSSTTGPDVLDLQGFGALTFGSTVDELSRQGAVRADESACGGQVATASSSVRPVFSDNRLVLLWADPPVHTPEGIHVGSTTDAVRQAYPDGAELKDGAPGSFPALLAPDGDRTYLFLHDGAQVQKVLAGDTGAAQRFYSGGMDAC